MMPFKKYDLAILIGVIFVFVLSMWLSQCSITEAHADTGYRQQQADALFERLVRAQEDQAKTLQEIARQLGRK